MDNTNETELWEKIDTMRNRLEEQWEATNQAYNEMTAQTDDALKAEKARQYHEEIEKANQMETDICDLLDMFEKQ